MKRIWESSCQKSHVIQDFINGSAVFRTKEVIVPKALSGVLSTVISGVTC